MPNSISSGRSARKAKWRIRLLACIISLVLGLIFLEVGSRLVTRLFESQRIMTPDNGLGWRLIPNTRKRHHVETSYLIAVNSHGFRDRDRDWTKPAGTRRIVVIGDSFVFGYGGVEFGERFTDLLEASLEKTEVLNLGVPSYSTDQESLQLESIGLKYAPDMVLLCVYANDYRQCFQSYAPDVGKPKGYFSLDKDSLRYHPPEFTLLYRLSQRSYIFGVIDNALRITRRLSGPLKNEMLVREQDQPTLFKRILSKIKQSCDEAGAELRIVYIPGRYETRRNILQDLLADWSAHQSVRYLDLTTTPPFSSQQALLPYYFRVDTHINVEGHQQVAAQLRDFLAYGPTIK